MFSKYQITMIPVFKLPSPEHAIRVNPQTQELQET